MLKKLKYELKRRLPHHPWLLRLYLCLRYPYQRVDYLLYIFPPDPGAATAPALPQATEAMLERLGAPSRLAQHEYGILCYCLRRRSIMPMTVDDRQTLSGWTLLSTFPHRSVYAGIIATPGQHSFYNHNTKVLPEARGQGFGTALNREVLRFTQDRCVYCLVRADNPPAIRNWEKCGKTPVGKLQCRRWFLFRWRHRLRPLAPGWRQLPVSTCPADLELHGPPDEWTFGPLRIRCQ